jgi:Holliday junction resolvase RusA-like endonuclease
VATQEPPLAALHPSGFPAAALAGRAASFRFFIVGKPVPKGRPRSRITTPKGRASFVHVYTDKVTVGWEEHVSTCIQTQIRELGRRDITLPFAGRVLITLRVNLRRPKSTPKTVLWPTKSRSDVDNLAKAILDAAQNAGVIANDCLVTDLYVCKRFADEDHPEGVELDLTGII